MTQVPGPVPFTLSTTAGATVSVSTAVLANDSFFSLVEREGYRDVANAAGDPVILCQIIGRQLAPPDDVVVAMIGNLHFET